MKPYQTAPGACRQRGATARGTAAAEGPRPEPRSHRRSSAHGSTPSREAGSARACCGFCGGHTLFCFYASRCAPRGPSMIDGDTKRICIWINALGLFGPHSESRCVLEIREHIINAILYDIRVIMRT